MSADSLGFVALALQPRSARGRPGSGFTEWLVESLINPNYHNHPLAPQTARQIFSWSLGLVCLWLIGSFLAKRFAERRALRHGPRRLAHGPGRSRVTLLVSFVLYVGAHIAITLGTVRSPLELLGLGNILAASSVSGLFYAFLFLAVLGLTYPEHMPWRRRT